MYRNNGRPLLFIHRSEFGPDGLPRQIVKYNVAIGLGRIRHIDTYQIESLVLDQPIPDEVF